MKKGDKILLNILEKFKGNILELINKLIKQKILPANFLNKLPSKISLAIKKGVTTRGQKR